MIQYKVELYNRIIEERGKQKKANPRQKETLSQGNIECFKPVVRYVVFFIYFFPLLIFLFSSSIQSSWSSFHSFLFLFFLFSILSRWNSISDINSTVESERAGGTSPALYKLKSRGTYLPATAPATTRPLQTRGYLSMFFWYTYTRGHNPRRGLTTSPMFFALVMLICIISVIIHLWEGLPECWRYKVYSTISNQFWLLLIITR